MSERKLLVLMTAEQAETFAQLVAAAELGDGAAACRLGDMYREGLGGVRYSPKQAHHWYARSAMAGDASGQNNLGACYEHGLGCAQSYPRAANWYRLSAAQGLGTASMNLGYCHLRGHGVAADKEGALRLFREAVEQGEDRAAKEVERLDGAMNERKVWTVRGIRFVDETRPGKHFGIVGAGGVSPTESGDGAREELKAGWTDEDFERVSLGAWEKDDCFDLPPPESEYAKQLRADTDEYIQRLVREGSIPPLSPGEGASNAEDERTRPPARE